MNESSQTVLKSDIKPKFYLDSVALMRHSKVVANCDGVIEAAMMMATPANIQIMHNAGLLDSTTQSCDGGDLIITVLADTAAAANAAFAVAEDLLAQPNLGGSADAWRPRSIRSAVQNHPGANLALISVPGDFAASEARKAIRRGLHAMIFSDNVPIAQEVALKQEARALGKLVMGPDCGTAIVNGVPLAFANRVPKGNIAIVGASGTGIQEVSCLIADAGQGISQAIGVGGRDLSEAVGGISTLMAMEMLERDANTNHVVLISKPPAPAVVSSVLAAIEKSDKAYTVCFIGASSVPTSLPENAQLATTLKQAAELSTGNQLFGNPPDLLSQARSYQNRGKSLISGLFAGGTLCAEAQVVFARTGQRCRSNAPIPGSLSTDDGGLDSVHTIMDLGADEFTQGRPHPMIEPSVRDVPLREALDNTELAAIILDVVIGYGASDDPAGHLANEIRGMSDLPFIVASVTGTDADPQVRSKQVSTLTAAGIVVAPSNADACELALETIA